MDAIGIRMAFLKQKWPELKKMSEAGKLKMWGLGVDQRIPDGDAFSAAVQAEHRHVERRALPPARVRPAVRGGAQAARLAGAHGDVSQDDRADPRLRAVADAGLLLGNVLAQPWVHGYRQHPFLRKQFRYYDVDRTPGAGAGR